MSDDKTDVKPAQGNMSHAGPEIMLRKYAQLVTPEMQSAQVRCESCRLSLGQNLLAENAGVMQSNELKGVLGERGRTRTCDPCLKRALLYQLSYAPTANATD